MNPLYSLWATIWDTIWDGVIWILVQVGRLLP